MKEIHEYFSEGEILTGMFLGDKVTFPRTDSASFETWLPFAL